jgi:hypothetical protein
MLRRAAAALFATVLTLHLAGGGCAHSDPLNVPTETPEASPRRVRSYASTSLGELRASSETPAAEREVFCSQGGFPCFAASSS